MIMPKDYMGDFLPLMVLYIDGQIMRNGKDGLFEEQLSPSERCEFLKTLVQSGIFEIEATGELDSKDPIYEDLDPDLSYIDDSPGYTIVINGNPAKKVRIKIPAIDYLAPQAKALLDLVDQFQPDDMQTYLGEKYLLYITTSQEPSEFYLTDPQPKNWPKGMPKLKELIGKKQDIELLLTQEQVDILLPYFNRVPGMVMFSHNENGLIYWQPDPVKEKLYRSRGK